VQEERVLRGEPSDRLNVVQLEMIECRDRYEILKELLKDKEFSNRVLLMQEQVRVPEIPRIGPGRMLARATCSESRLESLYRESKLRMAAPVSTPLTRMRAHVWAGINQRCQAIGCRHRPG